jgi:hypothetical protein
MCRRGNALVDRFAQGIQECLLQGGNAVGVLGEQERCLRASSHASVWPGQPRVVSRSPSQRVLSSSTRWHSAATLVREPSRVLSLARRDQVADPLILVTPSQQFLPQFYVHAQFCTADALCELVATVGQILAKPVMITYEGLTGQALSGAAGRPRTN